MLYLTYEEYSKMGGELDLTAFCRNIDRACAMIDIRTHSRLKRFVEIPNLVKTVCLDLVEYIAKNTVYKGVSGISQSAGGVSESITYTVKTAEDYANDIDRIFEPLATIVTANGTSLLYRGAIE